jgi:hypothetical protein
MSLTRSSKLVVALGLALLAGCLTANPASAQDAFKGSFTLPFEARWGNIVLPPGEYSFTLSHPAVDGIVTIQKETGRYVGRLLNQGVFDQQRLDRSELILVRRGGNYRIRALRLADLGLTLEYAVPKAERQLTSQAPQLLQRIPVIRGG